MKPSYSTRWLLCWTVLVLALLTLVAGIFAYSTDWLRGLGLTLIGVGLAGPAVWWLRRASRNSQVRQMKTIAGLGVLIVAGGMFVLPWENIVRTAPEEELIHTREDVPESSIEELPTKPSSSASKTTRNPEASEMESSSSETPSLTAESGPAVTITEPAVTITEPAVTIKEVETVAPPRVTIYSEVPAVPALPQTSTPNMGEPSIPSGPSDDFPSEQMVQTESTGAVTTGNETPQLQDPMVQGRQNNGNGIAGADRNSDEIEPRAFPDLAP